MSKCGDCQVCCEVMGVTEIEKPQLTKCRHQCATGCSIYKSRPKSCAHIKCEWLLGDLPVEYRPDNSGVFIYKIRGHEVISAAIVKDDFNYEFLSSLTENYKTRVLDARVIS